MSKGMFWCRLLALGVFVVSPALFAAEGPQVYSGTLGKAAIVMELDLRDPEQVTGRYFYRKYHHDLALEGRLQDRPLSLIEGRDRYDNAPRPELRLQRSSHGWQGEWVGPQGKRLAVKLTQPTIEEPPAGAEPFWLSAAKPNGNWRPSRLKRGAAQPLPQINAQPALPQAQPPVGGASAAKHAGLSANAVCIAWGSSHG